MLSMWQRWCCLTEPQRRELRRLVARERGLAMGRAASRPTREALRTHDLIAWEHGDGWRVTPLGFAVWRAWWETGDT